MTRSDALSPAPLAGELRLLLTAVQYFTRLPVPAWVGHDQQQLNRAARYFPLVGLLVGSMGAGMFYLLSWVLPQPLPAILSTIVTIALTGAFHEDGLADTFDGLGGGYTRERALEIMKDSRVGTYGALALFLTVITKIAALSALPASVAVVALIMAHPFSRWCAVTLIWRMEYAGSLEHSRARPVAQQMSPLTMTVATTTGIVPLLLLTQVDITELVIPWFVVAAVSVGAALLALLWISRWVARRLGGYTGDTLGATQQLTEVCFYLGMLIAWTSF